MLPEAFRQANDVQGLCVRDCAVGSGELRSSMTNNDKQKPRLMSKHIRNSCIVAGYFDTVDAVNTNKYDCLSCRMLCLRLNNRGSRMPLR